MASSFAITTTTNSILLDKQRHGEAVFSVYNASGQAKRGRARLTADNAAAKAWLSLLGATERDFAIAGIEQFTVQIAVPLDAPAGNYTFRLDMIGVDNPDEDLTQGPSVTFQVLPPPPPPKKRPWWIIIVVAVVLVVIVVVVVILTRPTTVPMPDVVGLQVNVAETQVTHAGLVPQTQTEASDTVTTTFIIRTDPVAGTPVKKDSTVTLTVSLGQQVTIPSINGLNQNAASNTLASVGLATGTITNRCGGITVIVPAGLVMSSSPPQGATVAKGSSVNLSVSNGLSCIIIRVTIPPIVLPAVGATPTPTP